ncbi:MAG: IS66 family transposase [Pseudomonadales bacterium]|nr:IS66 family transposase [Pseudomonadales bacterium]MBL4868112.1 IS66 family transposase [Pseudomonadales bacterium]
MTKDGININETVQEVERLLAQSNDLPPALEASINMLLLVVKLLVARTGLNSRNSSKPPSSDPNRAKTNRPKSNKPRGGQKGHKGCNLDQVSEPDEISSIEIDRRTLPRGEYSERGYQKRQVFDIRIARHVIEYRAQVLENVLGKRFVAPFPPGVERATQYGASIRANAVYMSMFQLIPYERIRTHFDELFGIPISSGSLVNFNVEAYQRLEVFEALAVKTLQSAPVLHVDETGVNVDGKRLWLHNASNAHWTLIAAHEKRGKEAMDAINVIPHFSGLLVHDHWKPYYRYEHCDHVLCNAHHKRELTRAYEQDGQQWALKMENLLDQINAKVKEAGGSLTKAQSKRWRGKYRTLLTQADKECPPPDASPPGAKKRGRIARSKSRNLLERLRDYEEDVLRFMENPLAPYTNNQGERDLRMTKVQQKISGCFRSKAGADTYCRIRSYLSTCRKHNVGVGEALECLFAGKWPEFIQRELDLTGECAE